LTLPLDEVLTLSARYTTSLARIANCGAVTPQQQLAASSPLRPTNQQVVLAQAPSLNPSFTQQQNLHHIPMMMMSPNKPSNSGYQHPDRVPTPNKRDFSPERSSNSDEEDITH